MAAGTVRKRKQAGVKLPLPYRTTADVRHGIRFVVARLEVHFHGLVPCLEPDQFWVVGRCSKIDYSDIAVHELIIQVGLFQAVVIPSIYRCGIHKGIIAVGTGIPGCPDTTDRAVTHSIDTSFDDEIPAVLLLGRLPLQEGLIFLSDSGERGEVHRPRDQGMRSIYTGPSPR